jgi:hypothetical protein
MKKGILNISFKHFKTICVHKSWVSYYCNIAGLSKWQAFIHDLSKFSKQEFDAYRRNHYPVSDEEQKASEDDYLKAWDHHKSVNPHHPYFWTQSGIIEDMPLQYIFEMLCDWAAVSQHMAEDHGSKDSLVDWYDKSAKDEKALFSDRTRKAVDFWVDEIFRKPGVRH